MATPESRPTGAADPQAPEEELEHHYCAIPIVPEPEFDRDVNPERVRAIISTADKWVNGTRLQYHFFNRETDGQFVFFADGRREWRSWVGAEDQKKVVRDAFAKWKSLGIGLEFEEVDTPEEAEIRIGFQQGDGSWSYLGSYALKIGTKDRTMNFGWPLRGQSGMDTALHETGHSLGLPHEHQNPFAGIVWDEEAVYASLAKPPNNWSRDKTHFNIIRKIAPDTVQGSTWDPDSVMHYPFGPGMIKAPAAYRQGIFPRGGLSERDQAWVRSFYPALDPAEQMELVPARSVQLAIRDGEQQNFSIRPPATRRYNLRTFGTCDTVMVLFEEVKGKLRYRAGDDDSGEDRNASLRVRMYAGRRYVLRVRLRYSDTASPPTVMMW